MFEPVVKRTFQAREADALGPSSEARARARRRRAAGLPRGPDRPAERRGDRRRRDRRRRAVAAPDDEHLARAAPLLEHARRPLIWAGGGALQADAGEAVAALAERLVAPVMLTYSARGCSRRTTRLVEATPHVARVGALWDEADAVIAIGTDLDGMMTQGWKQPQPPHLIAINVDPGRRLQELPARRAGGGRRRRGRRAPWRSASASAAGSTPSRSGSSGAEPRRPRRPRRDRPRGARLPRGDRAPPCPTTP